MPAPLKTEAARLQDQLQAGGSDLRRTIKWVGPEGLHLTLKFLGDVEDAGVPEASEVLSGVAAETPPLALEVRGLGGFPSLRAPRVIWIGVSGPDRSLASLRRLHALLEGAFEGIGYPREPRPFAPHVTLGRARPGCRPMVGPDGTGHGGARAVTLGTFEAREVLLMKSDLRPTGAVYATVCAASFTRPHQTEGVVL